MNDRFAGAVPYLRAFARVLGGHAHLTAAPWPIPRAPPLARLAIRRLLPEHAGTACRRRAKGPPGSTRCRPRIWPRDRAPTPGCAIRSRCRPPEGAGHEVAPGVLWMRLPLPMALDHVNVYALDDGDGWTMVDTGLDSRRRRAIWETLLAGPLPDKPVTRVIVTHHHPDHIGLAGWFQARRAPSF